MVAAMTIPTLMTKIQWIVLKQQYKKVFSVLNQSLRQVYYNTDRIYNCYYYLEGVRGNKFCTLHDKDGNCIAYAFWELNECKEFAKEWQNVLKVSHVCEKDSYAKGCIPKYKGNNELYKENNPNVSEEDALEATRGCISMNTNYLLKKDTTYVLQDGTIILMGPDNFADINVDINGKKGPNKWGYDIFNLTIRSDGNKLYFGDGVCSITEKGGKTRKQMLE